MDAEHCIYCREVFDPSKGEGDHIIPAALGEFRGDVRFRRVCPDCNNRIGESEQQLLQCGPEAFFRQVVRPAIPRGRRRGRSQVGGAHGMPGPEHTAWLGDSPELVNLPGDVLGDATPVDQVVVQSEDGTPDFVRLYPRMRPEQLREAVARKGVTEFKTLELRCDDARFNQYQSLIEGAWPSMTLIHQSSSDPGKRKVKVRIEFRFDDRYFRALAKIAFHYYLVRTQRGIRGDEPEFAPIREFILEGGEFEPFFKKRRPRFVDPSGKPPWGPVTPTDWCHLIAADESRGEVIGYVSLFFGPGAPSHPYHVTLGRVPGTIILPYCRWADVYIYDRNQPERGYAGRVERASLTRIA